MLTFSRQRSCSTSETISLVYTSPFTSFVSPMQSSSLHRFSRASSGVQPAARALASGFMQNLDIDELVSQHYSKAQVSQIGRGRHPNQFSAAPPAGSRPSQGPGATSHTPSPLSLVPEQGTTDTRSEWESGAAQATSRSPLGHTASGDFQSPQGGSAVPQSVTRGFHGAEGGHVSRRAGPGDGSGITHQSPGRPPGPRFNEPEGARAQPLERACSHGVKVPYRRPDTGHLTGIGDRELTHLRIGKSRTAASRLA